MPVQAGPYTARTYDGSTPAASFVWDTPEGRAAAPQYASFMTLLSIIRATLAMEDDSATKGAHLLGVLLAKGFDSLDNLPPFPLPGDHADVKASTLAISMAFWVAMETWLQSPQTVTVATAGGAVPVTDTPLTVFRRLMPGGSVQ